MSGSWIDVLLARLREAFPDYAVSAGPSEPPPAPPSLELAELATERQRLLGGRWREAHRLAVICRSAERADLVAERLLPLLAAVPLADGRFAKGSAVSRELAEGKVVFTWSVSLNGADETERPPLMGSLREEVEPNAV
ncbi:hypothetical protein HGI30_17085 [Paenibacillus albicereus]|uniref:Uncharacterized protein n=1 Tax=Paenibacillus albicereus TaxID=2726185 RepID=A0A6H2H0D2_9BACL|nr:hypothetical protein [Paenibacillus albicereus]QJC53120.1 hypothetical protein HGI30_17085 [Paenibacillus albicereus]